MTKQVTSIDVALKAGVSQPTVSRAFDPDSPVSDETRQRVLQVAAELGYQPNAIARSLITRSSNIIGVVLANITNSLFYPAVLEQLTGRLQEEGKQTLLFSLSAEQPVDTILPQLLAYQVDALVIASTAPSEDTIEQCTRRGTPVVLFNRLAPETSANSVCCDNVAGGQMIADLLLDRGHERLAFLSGVANTATNAMREKGFIERLQERGYEEIIREEGDYTYASGYSAAERLLALPAPPDAIFCAADIMALGAIDAIRAAGLSVPNDVSIAGFDDIAAAGWPAYQLTTIRQPIAEMTETVVSLILSEETPTGQVIRLPGELIQRGSVRQA